MALSREQKKAIALAEARARLKKKQNAVANYMARNDQLPKEYMEEASFREAAGRGMMDVYQGAKQLGLNALGMGDDYNQQLKEELQLYNERNPGLQAGRIAGNIATPLSLLPSAAGTGAVRALSVPGMGALFGAIQPTESEDFWTSKGGQAAVGAAVAPVLPLAGKAVSGVYKTGKKILHPLSEAGRKTDIEELIRHKTGDDAANVISALQNRRTHLTQPTTAQAIADAQIGTGKEFGAPIVRLERDLAKTAAPGSPLRSRYAEQALARKSAISSIAKTKEQLARSERARRTASDPYYKSVERSLTEVDPGSTITLIDDFIKKNPNETGITGPLRWIRSRITPKKAKDPNTKEIIEIPADLKPNDLRSLLSQIKIMAGKKNAAGQSEYNKTALRAVKNELERAIGETEDAFKMAQTIYRKGSKPINRMKVGRELAEALENSLEAETPASFANAVQNAPRTLRRANQIDAYTDLSDILNPRELEKVELVTKELIRQKQESLMQRSVLPIVGELEKGFAPSLPRVLERSVVIANAALRKLGVDKSDEYQRQAIEMLMNPESIIQALKQPADSKTRKLAHKIVMDLSARIPAQTTGRQAGEE